ncbi:MAG: cob(I)yrinic acid a,c-diamide adenosyltransferase [Parvibaculales bacterium]
MVKLTKIYTRTGDDGTTGLADGSRRAKNDARIMAYGAVDEANATLGIARLHSQDKAMKIIDDMLARLQNDMFDLGSDLATPEPKAGEELSYTPLRIQAEQVTRLEAEIDQLNQDLEPLNSFILPGGTPLAAYLHLARTTMRRAERQMVAAQEVAPEDRLNPLALKYANRASDLLFVMSRWANLQANGDILWIPKQNQN